mmetsp:Transcript_135617/g.433851  ORF Transcript_135617/g.433851 Transcript_135617/m.433851 type:complete len:435 (-) Transcript_135617:903-2207(-)
MLIDGTFLVKEHHVDGVGAELGQQPRQHVAGVAHPYVDDVREAGERDGDLADGHVHGVHLDGDQAAAPFAQMPTHDGRGIADVETDLHDKPGPPLPHEALEHNGLLPAGQLQPGLPLLDTPLDLADHGSRIAGLDGDLEQGGHLELLCIELCVRHALVLRLRLLQLAARGCRLGTAAHAAEEALYVGPRDRLQGSPTLIELHQRAPRIALAQAGQRGGDAGGRDEQRVGGRPPQHVPGEQLVLDVAGSLRRPQHRRQRGDPGVEARGHEAVEEAPGSVREAKTEESPQAHRAVLVADGPRAHLFAQRTHHQLEELSMSAAAVGRLAQLPQGPKQTSQLRGGEAGASRGAKQCDGRGRHGAAENRLFHPRGGQGPQDVAQVLRVGSRHHGRREPCEMLVKIVVRVLDLGVGPTQVCDVDGLVVVAIRLHTNSDRI